jgi:isopentenyl-diphosphate delta-isomerase
MDLGTVLLEKPLAAPVIISSMTGGVREASGLNTRLAEAAQAAGIGMGVGSQRAVEMIEADALILHLSPLREPLQPEGQARFGGLLTRYRSDLPVLGVVVYDLMQISGGGES